MPLQLVKPRLHELRRIRVVANYQFGKGASKAFPKTILITRSPNTHRIRHIYNGNELLATYRPNDGSLALSTPGGRALRAMFKPPRPTIEAVAGKHEFLKMGGSVFSHDRQQVKQVDDVTRVIIESASKRIVIDNPEVAIVTVQGQTVYQVGGGTAREEGPGGESAQEDAKLVASQAEVSVEEATKALQQSGGDLAQAIIILKQKKTS